MLENRETFEKIVRLMMNQELSRVKPSPQHNPDIQLKFLVFLSVQGHHQLVTRLLRVGSIGVPFKQGFIIYQDAFYDPTWFLNLDGEETGGGIRVCCVGDAYICF